MHVMYMMDGRAAYLENRGVQCLCFVAICSSLWLLFCFAITVGENINDTVEPGLQAWQDVAFVHR